MRSSLTGLLAVVLLSAVPLAADPLAALTDEFDSAATISNWSRVMATEGWNADQVQTRNINTSRTGWFRMVPYTSTWYENYRGELSFKNVTGNFVITTTVQVSNRAQTAAPASNYSLAGIMVRTPRAISNPATEWAVGGENYVFLSHGAGNTPGTFQFEVKTTENSVSTLFIDSAGGQFESTLQVARLGDYLIMLRRTPTMAWQVHRRYYRPDMPSTLQVGMTVYTDYNGVVATGLTPFQHNGTVIAGQNPDLSADFDYMRYATPTLPPAFVGVDLTNTSLATDAALLAFLGAAAIPPASVNGWVFEE